MSAKSALRLLLRAVDRHVTSVAGNQQWRQHILQQFRDNVGLQDAAQQQQMVLLAQEYVDLISNVAHHQVGGQGKLQCTVLLCNAVLQSMCCCLLNSRESCSQ
jgi:P2-related tail formation protein